MARPTTRTAAALAGTLVVLMVVPWLAGVVIGRLLIDPDPERAAWVVSLVLPVHAVVVAAGILVVGALGWRARSRLVSLVDLLGGAALLLLVPASLVVFDTDPSPWLASIGTIGGAMLVTGVASLVVGGLTTEGHRPRTDRPTGAWAGVVAALAVAVIALLVGMGFDYLVLEWQWQAQNTGGDRSTELRGLLGSIGILIEVAGVLVVGAAAIRARSLLVGAVYASAGVVLLALPVALTALEAVPPLWLSVVPAAGDVEAALVIAGLVSIGLAVRDRPGRSLAGTPSGEPLGA